MVNSNGAFEYRRSESDGPRNTEARRDGIPADDGMQALRQQLHEIHLLAVSTEEKARQMHSLMTTQYERHRHEVASPAVLQTRHGSDEDDLQIEPGWEFVPDGNPYKLQPGDTDATISTLPRRPVNSEGALEIEEEEEDLRSALGCKHYKRNVKIQCFDCERWFNCRHCHDAAPDLPFVHVLNRKKTRNMLCMLCKTPQPASEVCNNCGEYAAWYYCSKCKLWDNDIHKRIYHCDDCGLCRVGEGLGKDFVHCRRCNVCISISTSNSHPCIERATDSDCPLCLTYLFESRTPVVSLPCGHYMHGDCYKDLMAVTYKCPVCNKSAVNMELQWRKLDDEIAAQPMPEDDEALRNLLPHIDEHTPPAPVEQGTPPPPSPQQQQQHGARPVWIGCNDCGARSSTNFHWLGLKCQVCGGYNTNQMAPPAGRETETERLLRQQAQHRQHDFTGNYVLRDVGIGRDDEDAAMSEDSPSALDSSCSPPTSPSRPPLAIRRASDAHSPSGRYFVQAQEQRRSSSFTAPRFSAPSMPTLPALPNLPRMPDLSGIRDLHMPSLPQLPHLPAMPGIELSRFSPYEMAAVLSRSLSPMRYAREGGPGQMPRRRGSSLNYQNSMNAESWQERTNEDNHDHTVLVSSNHANDGETLTDISESNKYRYRGQQEELSDDDDMFAELVGHP